MSDKKNSPIFLHRSLIVVFFASAFCNMHLHICIWFSVISFICLQPKNTTRGIYMYTYICDMICTISSNFECSSIRLFAHNKIPILCHILAHRPITLDSQTSEVPHAAPLRSSAGPALLSVAPAVALVQLPPHRPGHLEKILKLGTWGNIWGVPYVPWPWGYPKLDGL